MAGLTTLGRKAKSPRLTPQRKMLSEFIPILLPTPKQVTPCLGKTTATTIYKVMESLFLSLDLNKIIRCPVRIMDVTGTRVNIIIEEDIRVSIGEATGTTQLPQFLSTS